jgi:hypothetical protein
LGDAYPNHSRYYSFQHQSTEKNLERPPIVLDTDTKIAITIIGIK